MKIVDLSTPALLADAHVLKNNISIMASERPGLSLRPHVKAFKSTSLAKELVKAGHSAFCCATLREIEGMIKAGISQDLLLANEVLNSKKLRKLTTNNNARITVAVDSPETIHAAIEGGIREVLIDINVGLPRCGCEPGEAEVLADMAKNVGLKVRGVMGYEGHLMHEYDPMQRAKKTHLAMELLTLAHSKVGGEVISGGGTGTWDCNKAVTELQAGSYVLMDGDYAKLGLPFNEGLLLLTSVISMNKRGYVVLDGGLKALAVDSGKPRVLGAGEVMFCSDEHTTVTGGQWSVGERVGLRPSHIDPTIAKHEFIYLVDNLKKGTEAEVVDTWPVDLRGW